MKSRPHFKFRQFSVADDQCHMKVGTDAVLLGAWADMQGARHILDIGTGSGVIALIAAQRTTDAFIEGIDIQNEECEQARSNAQASPWADRVSIVQSAIQDFYPPYTYDAILCNPPYFVNSLLPPVSGRSTARHTVSLTHESLIAAVQRLLSPTGNASFILPYEEGKKFKRQMEEGNFSTERVCLFRTRQGRNVERMLLSFERNGSKRKSVREEELLLYGEDNQWTQAYANLTGELYLPRTSKDAQTE